MNSTLPTSPRTGSGASRSICAPSRSALRCRWRWPTRVQFLTALQLDVVVPQMFCLPGMTSYRALFDVLGIPVVGNTPDVMALAADKAKAKAVVAAAGVRVPAGEVLRRGEQPSMAPPVGGQTGGR